jgi:hypothetical protein
MSLPEASSMIPAALRERDHATGPRTPGEGPGLPPPQAGVDAAVDARGPIRDAADAKTRPSAASASQVPDKTEALAGGSPASTGRITAWVALPAGTPERRPTHGTEAQAAALRVLKKAQPVYDVLIALADPAAPPDAPGTLCRRLLARLQAMLGADDADAWQNFVGWAQQTGKPPRLLHVLAASAAAREEDWSRAFRHAKTAIAMSQRDLFAQRLFLRARARIDRSAATVADDLSDFFCVHPFESFELMIL